MTVFFPSQSEQQDKILVVDDSPDNLFLVQHILGEEGHEIILAPDGVTALDIIRRSPPQLILLDVMMPKMDGFEVTRHIRQEPGLPFIPILLITAYDQPSVVTGLDSGADDFIRKPVEVEELLARVRSLLRLKHTVDERDQILRQREDFVSRLTHDLRTPLVAADRMLNLMQQGALGELSPEMTEAIMSMARSNSNLLEMVNTLLEVYRYEAGRKNLNFLVLELIESVREVMQELQPLAREKGLSLEYSQVTAATSSSLSTKIRGDRLEILRLFTNLIGNSIKFTDRGKIEVSLTNEVDKEGNIWVLFAVKDTGSGISAADQQWLFDRFRQGSHRLPGSGLGLHLSRQIVESHQGTITVESELGKGSLFTVRLPSLEKE